MRKSCAHRAVRSELQWKTDDWTPVRVVTLWPIKIRLAGWSVS